MYIYVYIYTHTYTYIHILSTYIHICVYIRYAHTYRLGSQLGHPSGRHHMTTAVAAVDPFWRTRPHGCSSKCLLCNHRGPGPEVHEAKGRWQKKVGRIIVQGSTISQWYFRIFQW